MDNAEHLSREESEIVLRIADLRKEKQLTQRELSNQVGVTENTLANWEKGRNVVGWIKRFKRLCDALDCKFEDLADEVEGTSLEDLRQIYQSNKLPDSDRQARQGSD